MTFNNTSKVSCTKDDENSVLMLLLIVGGWLSIVTCISGVLANTFSIMVLATKRMRILSTNTYLTALAIVNLLWLIIFSIFYAFRLTIIVPYFLSENHENIYSTYNQVFHRFSPYIIPLLNTCQLCIIYYTVAVSIDRYLYVSMGLNINLYCTVRNARRIIASLTIFAIIFILPYWFKYHVISHIDTKNRTHYRMSYTDIGQQRIFRQIISIYIYIPIVHVLPIITLIVSTVLTIRRLLEYHDEHRRLLSKSIRLMATMKSNVLHSRRHYHVTIMLIGVVLLFLLCRIPMLINQIYEIQNSTLTDNLSEKNRYFQCRIQRIFSTCANFMQTINSNGNLIIYLLCCRNFREASQEVLETFVSIVRLVANILCTSRRSRAKDPSSLPLILLYTHNHSFKTRDNICRGQRNGGHVVNFDRCPKKCQFSCRLEDFHQRSPHAVLFFGEDFFWSFHLTDQNRSSSKQRWIFWSWEAPINHPHYTKSSLTFNWTMTYRQDSDIVHDYGRYIARNRSHTIRDGQAVDFYLSSKDNRSTFNTNIEFQKRKNKILWFVSNCRTRTKRHEIAEALAKSFPIDQYGQCSQKNKTQNRESTGDFERRLFGYKFYLGFENANCQDYITEKAFYNALAHGSIPIVFGSSEENYRNILPPHSFIHVEHFHDLEDLTNELGRISKDGNVFKAYHAWRDDHRLIAWPSNYFIDDRFCDLCIKLYEDKEEKSYSNFSKWLNKCK